MDFTDTGSTYMTLHHLMIIIVNKLAHIDYQFGRLLLHDYTIHFPAHRQGGMAQWQPVRRTHHHWELAWSLF